MADNSLLCSKYIQLILESSLEVADILDPANAPHQAEIEEQEENDVVYEATGETGGTGEPGETGETGSTGEPEHDYTQRIFPLLQPDNLSFPFIVHSRTGITVEYTKDLPFHFGWTNTVNYTVSCVSDDYVECVELANAVRHALEGTRYSDEDIRIDSIMLLTVAEYTTDNDAFVEELQFQFSVE